MFYGYISARSNEHFVSGEKSITTNLRAKEGALQTEVYEDAESGNTHCHVVFHDHRTGTRSVLYSGVLGQEMT